MKTLVNALKSLSDETRLRIINLLYEKELCVCDIMETLKITQAKASRHLIYLKNAGLVTDRKQAQWVYYSIAPNDNIKFLSSLVYDSFRKMPEFNADLQNLNEWLKRKNIINFSGGTKTNQFNNNIKGRELTMKRKVLFLCTKNSARSQMAKAVLNFRGSNNFIAYSAGSNPANEIHPLAVKVLTKSGFDMTNKGPKSMEKYINEEFDFIITLCDRMKEDCPIFLDLPILAHWGMPDPADFEGTEEEKLKFFENALNEISQRITLFINIPIEKLGRMALEFKVREIGTATL